MEFRDMDIGKEMLDSLSRGGISTPTKIQQETIPAVMDGQDIRAQSETGSGKTLAFAIPIIERIEHRGGIQGLILAPTRELAKQITDEIRKFSRHKKIYALPVYGGTSMNNQIRDIPKTEIVVGTPGRILDLMERGELRFDRLRMLVLDEADRMLDMGFVADIERIISAIPKKVQTMLFSATYPPEIKEIARKYLNNPKKVVIESTLEKGKLLQFYYDINQRDKFSLLVHLLQKEKSETTLVFCKTKRMTDVLANNLYKSGIKAKALNGDMSQAKRDKVVEEFKEGRINVLVATDVAARGIHVEDISHVYNYDVPSEPSTYTHRIGRTARAGKTGSAVTLVCDRDYEEFGRIFAERREEIRKMEPDKFERVSFNMGGRRDAPRGERSGPGRGGPRGEFRRDRRDERGRGSDHRRGGDRPSFGRQSNPRSDRQSFGGVAYSSRR